jgi:Ca2+-binding RTX toxin-like protein
VAGNGGNDELYGQAGDDAVEGGYGSDAILGDLGKVTTDLLGVGSDATCSPPRTISPNEPFIQLPVCQPGTLFRLVQLYAFDDAKTNPAPVTGKDVLLGGDADDWIHGGAGSDLIQGDGDGGAEIVDPDADYTTSVTDPNPDTVDTDRLFGGDSNVRGTVDPVLGGDGDAIWGGRGNDNEYGGHGDDMLDVRPDDLYPKTWAAWAEADVESYHGVDFAYGGYDQDALQANRADNGPINGDRMFDWAGVYNITYLCPSTYGAYVTIRDMSPAVIDYWQKQALTDGAYQPTTAGTSGYDELAMVFKPDVKNNTNPVYPGTPGHRACFIFPP